MMAMELDLMIFDMDLTSNIKSKFLEETAVPCAPPPSPSLTSRKPMNFSIPLSKLVDSCEDLISRTGKISIGSVSSSPLHMKRKTNDSDDCYSSGSSPGGSTEYTGSIGKRSRFSLNLDNMTLFKSSDLSVNDLTVRSGSSCS